MTTIANALRFNRLRSPQELADARRDMLALGFTQCGGCGAFSNEETRCIAHGSARDPRCPACGLNPALLVED